MPSPLADEMLRALPEIAAALHAFASSPASFRLMRSTGPAAAAAAAPPRALLVLDSSFNPPTKAHLQLAVSSLASAGPHARLLLLLATQNADKAPRPAAFDERIAMMSLFAADLLAALPARPSPSSSSSPAERAQQHELEPPAVVDIAVTKHPRFLDKSAAIAQHYPGVREHVYLTGFDTLVRILDTKYYPVAYTLEPLRAFFARNRIRCTLRHGDAGGGGGGGGGGGERQQREYVQRIRRGEREAEGCRREWADRIELVAAEEETAAVSSTKVRDAVKRQDEELLSRFLTEGVRDWIRQRKLYLVDE